MANIVLDFLHNYQTGERRESEPANAYQYDEGHVLEAVLPEVITSCEIHYWIRGMEEADAYTPTSITPNSDGSCTVLGNIPNKYFETNGELRIYIVVTDGTASITTYEGKLHICQRSMPDDYVDDDPENEAVRVITEARAAAATATEKAGEAAASAEQAQEILDSIPEDYTQLTEDVSNLKEDLDDVETALETKAEIDGYYEDMTVGDAEQLVSTVTNADDTPYNFRTTAGSVDVGDRAYVDAIVGGTLNVNQLASMDAISVTGGTHVKNQDGSYTFTANASNQQIYVGSITGTAGRKYFVSAMYKTTTPTTDVKLRAFGFDFNGVATTNWQTNNAVLSAGYGGGVSIGVIDRRTSDFDAIDVKNIMCFDLTATFGTTIADYIYSLETATAGAGVAWLKANAPKIFNGGYIPFNAGTLQSVVGLSEKRNTGLNQWDEETELGTINNETGENINDNGKFRSKNYIRLVSGQDYYFEHKASDIIGVRYYDSSKNFIGTYAVATAESSLLHRGTASLPNNAMYMRFVNTSTNVYNHDICINLHWDGEKDGIYEPYTVHTYAFDPTVELRGVPKLKDGKMYFDGDRYLPDGTVQRRYGIVDLGTLDWTSQSIESQKSYYSSVVSDAMAAQACTPANIVVVGYKPTGCNGFVSDMGDKAITISATKRININDNAYTDAAAFKAAMSGVMLVYELAEPTTETATPYNPVEIVDDFGTEEFITTSLVPVGHETRYAPNLRAKLEMSPDSPDGDGLYIVQQSGGENTYIPLAASATIQNILERLTALEGNTNEG